GSQADLRRARGVLRQHDPQRAADQPAPRRGALVSRRAARPAVLSLRGADRRPAGTGTRAARDLHLADGAPRRRTAQRPRRLPPRRDPRSRAHRTSAGPRPSRAAAAVAVRRQHPRRRRRIRRQARRRGRGGQGRTRRTRRGRSSAAPGSGRAGAKAARRRPAALRQPAERHPGGLVSVEARLACIRGNVPPRNHNARTIAALTSNPGCARRAVLDAAGVDKGRLAAHTGFPAQWGQSQFAIARGSASEAQVKANGCAELLRLLRERLGLPIPEVAYDDLADVGGEESPEVRHARSRALLARAADGREGAGTLFDHPLLRIQVGGQWVFLAPDLIAFQFRGTFHVVEIKSFPVIDGQADGGKVAAAAIQSAVYVLALRLLLEELGHDP